MTTFSLCLHIVCLCLVTLSCLTLCGLVDWNPPDSVHRILQTRILEWVAVPSSKGSSWAQGSNVHLLHLLNWQAGSLPLSHLGSLSVILQGAKWQRTCTKGNECQVKNKEFISGGLDRMKLLTVHCAFLFQILNSWKKEFYLFGLDPMPTSGSITVAMGSGSHSINMTTGGLSPLRMRAILRERKIVSWGTIPRSIYYTIG